MNRVKKLTLMGLFVISLMGPTSAFASENTYTYNTNQYVTYQFNTGQYTTSLNNSLWATIVDGLFSFGGVQIMNLKTEKEVSAWMQRNESDCPKEESAEIWKRWYCGSGEHND